MIGDLIKRIFGTSHERELRRLQPLLVRINELEPEWKKKSDEDLRAMTGRFYERLDRGESLDALLPEAFATVREASVRTLGMRHYDVQLLGGMVLHKGMIAEMKTGEGKTLVATCPLYLNALERRGVHLVTVNDYLATRDADWMGRIYKFLGMSVGVIVHGQSDLEKQQAYNSDITYGTNNEFGFDYLRDNMKESIERYVQRELHYAIVDEVDSILIDEARTPLIISGPAEESADLYRKVNAIIPSLRRDLDYTVDEKHHAVALTEEGVEKVEKKLGLGNLYDLANIEYNHHVQQALRAHALYKRDVNYVVQDGKVIIVDEHTGRLMHGRRWSDGLHQAVEAKENVAIEEETQTLATISFQNLFRLYHKLAGMTGTADTEAEEFHKIYKLNVVVIPTHLPMIRKDHADLVYKNERGKFRAVINEIEDCHRRGQPVLVGTISVEKSEVLSSMLKKRGIPHTVLNAKQHAREAAIVAQAGRLGAVTIATNMAGRGTDILLGGNPEFMARAEVYGEELACRPGACDETTEEYKAALARFRQQTEEEKKRVIAAGGLHILGTERHESRRIDNQLRGRSGRQGDPGSSRFYLSLEDDLLRIFGAERITGLMERLGMEEDVPIEAGIVNRAIENAQRKVEAHHFDSRKHLLEYDDVMNQQRKAIYALRRQILEGRYVPELTEEEKKAGKEAPVPTRSGEWTIEGLADRLRPVITSLTDAFWLKPEPAEGQSNGAPADPGGGRLRDAREFTHELYRRFGSVIKFDRIEHDRKAVIEKACRETAASLIQQRERVLDLCDDLIARLTTETCDPNRPPDDWDLDGLAQAVKDLFNLPISLQNVSLDPEAISERIWEQVETFARAREEELGLIAWLYFARHFYLEVIDAQWIDHLKAMDHLREGIGLRGYGQRDPKQEYKKEGYNMFQAMMARIQENVAQKLFSFRIERQVAPETEAKLPEFRHKQRKIVLRHTAASTSGASSEQTATTTDGNGVHARGDDKARPVRREEPKIGRNEPCPCGSGKKYKKCHGASVTA